MSSTTYYKLIVHDYVNLAIQDVITDESKSTLNRAADNLVNLFAQAGLLKQFEPQVIGVKLCYKCLTENEETATQCKRCTGEL